MALFALYRILPGEDLVRAFFYELQPEGESTQHYCHLPNRPGLLEELTAELRLMGFVPEFERETSGDSETTLFRVHPHSNGAASSAADAIYAVCSRHGFRPLVMTTRRLGSLVRKPMPAPAHGAAAEHRVKA